MDRTPEPDVVARGRAALADTTNAEERKTAADTFVDGLDVGEVEELASTAPGAEPDRVRSALCAAAMIALERRGKVDEPLAEYQAAELDGSTAAEADRQPAGEELEPTDEDRAARLDRVLRFNGFAAIKRQLDGVIGSLAGLPLDALDALEHQARQRSREEEVKSNPGLVDAIEQDIAVAGAVRRFMEDLDAIGKRFEARAAIREGNGPAKQRARQGRRGR